MYLTSYRIVLAIIRSIPLLVLVESVCVAQGRPPSVVARRGIYTSSQQVDFRDLTYQVVGFSEEPSEVRLRDGSHVECERGLLTYSVQLYKLTFGELTGDGSEEVAVVLMTSGGGTGYMTEAFIYQLQNGRPVMLSRFEGGRW